MFMNEEEEETVLIKLKTGEHIVVPKQCLIADSAKFRELFVTLNFDEHEIDDFSPEAVEVFLTLLDTKVLDKLEMNMFRELHKLAVVFKVEWLTDSCQAWLKQIMNTASTNEEKTFLFEECWYIVDRLKNEHMMDELIYTFVHKDNKSLISDYLSDISSLKSGQIDALLRLGGVDTDIFLQSILQYLEDKTELDPNVKYLLSEMNLAWSRERNEILFLEVVDTISNLTDISVADMRFVQKLMSDTARLVIPRKQERKSRTTTVFDLEKEVELLIHNCGTINDLVKAVTDDRVTSMFKVVELLLCVPQHSIPNSEEMHTFVTSLESLCREKKLQKVSKQFIDYFTTALNYSTCEESELLINLLIEIKNNNQLSTHNGNVIIKCEKRVDVNEEEVTEEEVTRMKFFKQTVTENNGYKQFYTFKHPLSVNCTETDSKCGFILRTREQEDNNTLVQLCTESDQYDNTEIHTHDNISAKDMHCYAILSGTCGSNRVTLPVVRWRRWWWRWRWGWWYWLPDCTDGKFEEEYVAYNVKQYTVAK